MQAHFLVLSKLFYFLSIFVLNYQKKPDPRQDAILYWFEVKSTWNSNTFKTYDSLMIDKAAFLLPTPIVVDPAKNDFLTIEFAYEDFLIDLSVTE